MSNDAPTPLTDAESADCDETLPFTLRAQDRGKSLYGQIVRRSFAADFERRLTALQAEREREARDAERYRFLRDWPKRSPHILFSVSDSAKRQFGSIDAALDDAIAYYTIDAARSATCEGSAKVPQSHPTRDDGGKAPFGE